MKKIYDSYEDAIHQQMEDFILVTDTEILPDGRVCVTGDGHSADNAREDIVDSLPFKSWLIDQ